MPAADSDPRSAKSPDEFYLPDFCAARTVLAVVLVAELVAFILTFARHGPEQDLWRDLAKTSLFLLWIGLSSAAVLCYARPHLGRLAVPAATATSLALLLGTTLLISEATYWLGQYWAHRLTATPDPLFPSQHASFVLRNLGIGAIVSSLVLRYFYVSHQWKRNVEREAQSRIRALQARIRPHFLFNSMNTIAALTRSDPERAEEAVEDLADLFRASLSEASGLIRLKEELEVARIYQRIEQLRLGERLEVDWQIGELPMRAMVPGLTVQPLLENAIYHGIEALPDGGTVMISGQQDDGLIHLSVSNPVATESGRPEREGHRIALENIRERLELAYQGRARLAVCSRPGEYSVTVTFPYLEASG